VANKGVKGRQVLLVTVPTTRLRLAGRVATMKKTPCFILWLNAYKAQFPKT